MSVPKQLVTPAWVKALVLVNASTVTIDSIKATGANVKGAGFSYKLSYQSSLDRWLQGRYPLGGFAGTSMIDLEFTFKNKNHRVLSGIVTGLIDQTPLSVFAFSNLTDGASVSGKLSFHPLNVLGDHIITLSAREPMQGPLGSFSVVIAQTSTNYFVY